MNTYKIKVNYQTGDSENSNDATDDLGYIWNNLDACKASLKAIEEHYTFYMLLRKEYNMSKKQLEEALAKAEKQPWFTKNWENQLFIVDDKMERMPTSAFWCGYFESLWDAEIVTEQSDMKISFR